MMRDHVLKKKLSLNWLFQTLYSDVRSIVVNWLLINKSVLYFTYIDVYNL